MRLGDFSRLPVERLALALLEHATANPSLVRRGELRISKRDYETADAPPVHLGAAASLGAIPSLAMLSEPAGDVRQYLEDLASIAVNAAQQAEDALHQAHETSRRARRSMAAVAAFGMLGLVIGTAGFVAHKSTSSKLTAVSGQVRALEGQQRQASDQLTAVRATMDSLNADPERAVTTEASAGPPPALPQQAVAPEPPAMPARGTETPVYSTPWPDSRPYTHRAVVVQRRRAVVAPNFLVAINRDLRALFH